MPPKSQRSRACAQCRDRRVKCDETPETCNQCRRRGLQCSGPLVGSIVIDMTDRVARPRGRQKKETVRANVAVREKPGIKVQGVEPLITTQRVGHKLTPVDMPVLSPIFPEQRRYTFEVEQAVTAIRYQYHPPTFHQPTRVRPDALDNAFLAYYVSLNANKRTYSPEIQWLNHLPRLYAEARKPAVKLALRAVSMAFYAKLHNEPTILLDSWRWYTIGLNAQRRSIEALQDGDIPQEDEVMVPLILALYEVYVGVTSAGAMAHLSAAAKIMNLRGPSNCKTGAIWPLFKGIRNAEAHRSIIFGHASVYSSHEWMTVPFHGMPKDAHQELASIELRLPLAMRSLEIQGTLRVFFKTPIPANADVKRCRELVMELRKDLQEWSTTFPHLTRVIKKPEDLANFSKHSASGLDIANESSQAVQSQDTFLALIASNYVATKLLLAALMHKMATESNTPPPSPESRDANDYFEEAVQCSEAILRAAGNVEQVQTPGFDLLRSIGPLVSVVCIGPGEEQFRRGKEMLHRWGSKISGLNSVMDGHILGPESGSHSPSS